jgi:hypothetical protein
MQFYIRESKAGVIPLYYDITDVQLEHVVNHQYKGFPVRFFTSKLFCPMMSIDYARRVASETSNWIATKTKHVHILRFFVRSKFIATYAKGALDNDRTTICVPGDELKKVNQQIIGYVERLESIDLRDFYQSTGISV